MDIHYMQRKSFIQRIFNTKSQIVHFQIDNKKKMKFLKEL